MLWYYISHITICLLHKMGLLILSQIRRNVLFRNGGTLLGQGRFLIFADKTGLGNVFCNLDFILRDY